MERSKQQRRSAGLLRARGDQRRQFLSLALDTVERWRRQAASGGSAQADNSCRHAVRRSGIVATCRHGCGAQAGSRWRCAAAPGARLMFFPEGQIRVFLYGQPADMRCSFNGLQALTRQGWAKIHWTARFTSS